MPAEVQHQINALTTAAALIQQSIDGGQHYKAKELKALKKLAKEMEDKAGQMQKQIGR